VKLRRNEQDIVGRVPVSGYYRVIRRATGMLCGSMRNTRYYITNATVWEIIQAVEVKQKGNVAAVYTEYLKLRDEISTGTRIKMVENGKILPYREELRQAEINAVDRTLRMLETLYSYGLNKEGFHV